MFQRLDDCFISGDIQEQKYIMELFVQSQID